MSLVSPSPPFQSWEDTSYSRFPYVVYSRGIWLSARVSEDNPFTIYVSTNGINWSLAAENPPVHYFAAIDGLWAGINQNTRVIAISTNGLNWTEIGPPSVIPVETWLRGLDAEGALFYVYGTTRRLTEAGYVSVPLLVWSADGITWSPAVLPEVPALDGSFLQSIACGPQGCVALLGRLASPWYVTVNSQVLTSQDGITWSLRDLPIRSSMRSVAFTNGEFVIKGDKRLLLSSPDGLTWTRQSGSTTRHIRDLAARQQGHVAVGDSGLLLRSLNGVTWWPLDNITAADISAVIPARRGFVAVGGQSNAVVLRGNANASRWAVSSLPNGHGLRALAPYGDGALAVGLRGTVAWIRQNSIDVAHVSGAPDFRALTRFRGGYIALAHPDTAYPFQRTNSQVFTSTDGVEWIERFNHTNLLTSVAANAHRAIAIGSFGPLLMSDDGVQWRQVPHPPNDYSFYKIVYGGGAFIIAGRQGALYTSTDGLRWTTHNYAANGPVGKPGILYDAAIYGEAAWVAFAGGRAYAGPCVETIFRSPPFTARLKPRRFTL